VWEALIKHQLGKLRLPTQAAEYINSRRDTHRISDLPLETSAASRLLSLPLHHRDPFDRMLVCQALHHDLIIVTTDAQIRAYQVVVLSPAA